MKRLLVLFAALAVLVTAGAASAAPPDPAQPTEVAMSEVTAEVRDIDRNGKALGPWKRTTEQFGPNAPTLPPPAIDPPNPPLGPPMTPPGAPSTARVVKATAAQSTTGCRETNVYRRDYSWDGTLLWEVRLYRRWCWTYPRVTGAYATPYTRMYSGRFRSAGTQGNGGAYVWCCNVSGSGYFRYQEWQIQEIIPAVGAVIGTSFPWIDHRAFSNGGGAYRTDKNTAWRYWAAP